jgi:hypothetical protein
MINSYRRNEMSKLTAERLAQEIVDGMDLETVCRIAVEYLTASYETYSQEELEEEAENIGLEFLMEEH